MKYCGLIQYKDDILWFRNCHYMYKEKIDGLMQERRNSSALAMELRLSCINPLEWSDWLSWWLSYLYSGNSYSIQIISMA